MARNSRDLAQRPAVDPEDEPSAAWGWHGGFPRGTAIAGVFSIVALLAMAIGTYQTRTQDLWIIGTCLVIAFGLIVQVVRKRNAWRR